MTNKEAVKDLADLLKNLNFGGELRCKEDTSTDTRIEILYQGKFKGELRICWETHEVEVHSSDIPSGG